MAKRGTRAPGPQQPELSTSAEVADDEDGITYADESPDETGTESAGEDETGVEPPVVEAPPLEPTMSGPPDPDQARATIARMRRAAVLRQSQGSVAVPPPKLVVPHPADVEDRRPRLYRVLETRVLPQGASSRKFPQGKILDENSYNIEDLLNQGLKLEEYETSRAAEARR
jgi:hypothetical protein